MESSQSFVRISCIQMDVIQNNIAANLEIAHSLIKQACDNGATLLVLPEQFNVGIMLKTRKEAYHAAEPIPGETSNFLINIAQQRNVYIVASLIEREHYDLYNTAILVGPDGLLGKYRKLHPCGDEAYWLEGGNLGIPVFNTPIGRIAMLICLDAYYPETFRICALQSADIVCIPSNWSDVGVSRNLPTPYRTMAPTACMAGALCNYLFVAATNRVGKENGVTFPGQSVIANQWGAPIASAEDAEQIIYADVDLCDSRRRYFHPTNSRLANRRIDVYSSSLGYIPKKYLQTTYKNTIKY